MKPCKVEGCDAPSAGRGLCVKHYKRWKIYGSPTSPVASKGELPAFIARAIKYRGRGCLLWPYGQKNGYGAFAENGRMTSAHRVVCEAVHGPKPSPKHEVAHNCGVPACVNPLHLRWATRVENVSDRVRHGTHNRGEQHHLAKLSAEQVRVIRARTGQTGREIADEFGVSSAQISMIRNRRSWKHIP